MASLRATIHPTLVWLPCLALAACASLATEAQRRGGDAVTEWTLIGDCYGNGAANWRTLAVLQTAMHDALNAAHPVYGRWSPAGAGEPAVDGANPEVAMAAAAVEVLSTLHPEREAETKAAFASVMAHYPDDASKAAGRRLGSAIGRAAVARRARDGFEKVHFFTGDDRPGRWRPTPSLLETSRTNDIRPFLFATARDVPALPPPRLGTPLYRQELGETRSLGGRRGSGRTAEQTAAAFFWASQTGQRGFVNLAVRLLAAHPPLGGVYEEAHVMAELTTALADSAIITWNEKARFSFWRPITAIRADGVDVTWEPLIETPPFPEYPSGHATDCYVGAGVLEAAFPDLAGPIVYLSSAAMKPLDGSGGGGVSPTPYGMGSMPRRGRRTCREDGSVASRAWRPPRRSARARGSGRARISRPRRSNRSAWRTPSFARPWARPREQPVRREEPYWQPTRLSSIARSSNQITNGLRMVPACWYQVAPRTIPV